MPETKGLEADEAFAEEDLDEKPTPLIYVIATDENTECMICGLCKDRMRLEYLHDIEEWVYMDCVEHEGIPVHEDCRNTAFG